MRELYGCTVVAFVVSVFSVIAAVIVFNVVTVLVAAHGHFKWLHVDTTAE